MGNSDSLADPVKFRFLISTGCPPDEHRQGAPAFIVVWLPLRVTPVTPEAHLPVLAVFVRIDAPVFPLAGEGRQLHCGPGTSEETIPVGQAGIANAAGRR